MLTVTTNRGVFSIELDYKNAPQSCENFASYVRKGFYDGTVFHRVIPGFMVQGGGFDADMQQKTTAAPIQNEADNGLKNTTGTLAMARTADPHSATAQFFINVADNAFLNHRAPNQEGWGYCVFGKVTSGMDIVMDISHVQTGTHGMHQDVPLEPVSIESVAFDDEQ